MTALPTPTDGLTLEAASLATLTEHGAVDTDLGVLVLVLARQLDAGGHSGASSAALSAAWVKAREAALKETTAAGDVIDAVFSRSRA